MYVDKYKVKKEKKTKTIQQPIILYLLSSSSTEKNILRLIQHFKWVTYKREKNKNTNHQLARVVKNRDK